jgi:AsmA protein
MKRFFKVAGIIALIGVLVIAGAIIYLVSTVDLDQVKQEISEKVKEETGRELLITGPLDLSFFPWIKVEIGETHFGNPAGFSGDFASFSRAQASLKLMPLFSGQVEMNTLLFDNFTLNLHQRKDGANNWDDLAKPGKEGSATKPAAEDDARPVGALALFLEGIDIRNANVSFQDDKAGSTTALSNFNLSAGPIGLQKDVPFSIDFKINLSDPQIAGDYRIKGIANINLEAGLFNVRELTFDSELAASGLPVETIDLGIKADLVFDANRMQLQVKPFALQATFKGDEIPNQSAELSVDTEIAFDAKAMAATLKPLSIGFPGGTMQGDFAYAQKGEKQQVDFDLTADQIDLDRLVAPVPASPAEVTSDKAADSNTAGVKTAIKPAAKESQGLRNLLVDGDLKIGKLTKDALLISDIFMQIKMRDAVLDISPMTAKLYRGLASNAINVDLRGAAPKVKARLNLQGFQIGDYLQAAMEKDVVEGTADVNADLKLTAADADTIKRSLNGTAAFKVSEGALKGVNIPDLIRRAKAALSGQQLPPSSNQKTDFTELSGTAKISDGLVKNDDLAMKSPLLRISGAGSADLLQEQLDYLVTAKLVASLSGQGGDDLKDLVGVPLPIRVEGSFSEPGWKLDLKSVFEENIKAQAKESLQEALKDPQKVLDDPKKLLEGFKFK